MTRQGRRQKRATRTLRGSKAAIDRYQRWGPVPRVNVTVTRCALCGGAVVPVTAADHAEVHDAGVRFRTVDGVEWVLPMGNVWACCGAEGALVG